MAREYRVDVPEDETSYNDELTRFKDNAKQLIDSLSKERGNSILIMHDGGQNDATITIAGFNLSSAQIVHRLGEFFAQSETLGVKAAEHLYEVAKEVSRAEHVRNKEPH